MKQSLLSKISKDYNISELYNDLNTLDFRTKNLAIDSFLFIKEKMTILKSIVDIATDQEVSSGPLKISLSKIPIYSSKGLYIEDNKIKHTPILKDKIKIKNIRVNGNGSSTIPTIESNTYLNKTYFEEDILSEREFIYKANGILKLILDFSFYKTEKISLIRIEKDNSFTSKEYIVSNVYSMENKNIKYNQIHTNEYLYVAFEEEIFSTDLTIELSSNFIDITTNETLVKIKKIEIGKITFEEFSEIILGPIGNNNLSVVKAGISTDFYSENIIYELSNDLVRWYKYKYNSQSNLKLSLNTTLKNSLNIKTNKFYIRITINNKNIIKTISDYEFEELIGEDCFHTTLSFGESRISNNVIKEYIQSIYDPLLEKYIMGNEVSLDKKYRITLTPLDLINENEDFLRNYNSEIIINPKVNNFFITGTPFKIDSSISDLIYVYKLKEDYIPGIYHIFDNNIKRVSFTIYGNFLFSISKFILEKKEGMKLLIENGEGEKVVDISNLKTEEINGINYINLSEIILDTTYGNPALFYPFKFTTEESITENGVSIQNPIWAVQYIKVSNIDNNFKIPNISDIRKYNQFLKKKIEKIDRAKVIQLKHKKIIDIKIKDSLKQVNFNNGQLEFLSRRVNTTSAKVENGVISLMDINTNSKIEVFSLNYTKQFLRVFNKNDMVSLYNFYVEGNTIFLNELFNNETLYIVTEESVENLSIGDLYSVDYNNGIIYFSSFQNNFEVEYLYLDLYMYGDFYTKYEISQNDSLISYGINIRSKEISLIDPTEIPNIKIGVIYD